MPTIHTCGHESKRTEFTYQGDSTTGITLAFDSGDITINAATIRTLTTHFQGQRVRGGFSMTNAPATGVGAFLAHNSPALTPRHASFLCAVLHHEGRARCELDGNTVWVNFNIAPLANPAVAE